MRYYDLKIYAKSATKASDGTYSNNISADAKPLREWQSHPNGIFDPNALNIEFDVPVTSYDAPAGGQTITLHGVRLQDLQQSYSLQENVIVLRAGMGKGLPLAKPNQQGIILQGQIWQSFGNWEGTQMTLDMVVYPSVFTVDAPGNLVLIWTAGTQLKTAISNMLKIAYGDKTTVSINMTGDYVLPYDSSHVSSNLIGMAKWITEFTEKKFKSSVIIAINGAEITVTDTVTAPGFISIEFNDMVGQPTWIDPLTMQVKLIMRGDIKVGTFIQMPKNIQNIPGIVTTTSASLPSNLKYQSAFNGQFFVKELRHVGAYRTPNGTAWVTIANCVIFSGVQQTNG